MIRIFVGGTQEHVLPFKVLYHSIVSRTSAAIEVKLLDEWDHRIPSRWKEKSATTFSLQRFLMPEICDFEGLSIYLDNDMLLCTDIAELWTTAFPEGKRILSTPGWQTAVMLVDNSIGWKMSKIAERLDLKKSRLSALMNLRGVKELSRSLDSNWDAMDRPKLEKIARPDAKLRHFTTINPMMQPWIYDKHPCGTLWTNELIEALRTGFVSKGDVNAEIAFGNVRPSLALLIGENQQEEDHVWFERLKSHRQDFYTYPE